MLNLNGLSKGLYFVEISLDGRRLVEKVVLR